MMRKLCLNCQEVMEALHRHKQFCSGRCNQQYTQRTGHTFMSGATVVPRACAFCNTTFFAYPANRTKRFCSRTCSTGGRRGTSPPNKQEQTQKLCQVCNVPFYVVKSLLGRKYCSRKCYEHDWKTNIKRKMNFSYSAKPAAYAATLRQRMSDLNKQRYREHPEQWAKPKLTDEEKKAISERLKQAWADPETRARWMKNKKVPAGWNKGLPMPWHWSNRDKPTMSESLALGPVVAVYVHSLRRTNLTCQQCYNEFDVSESRVGKVKYCSRACYLTHRYGWQPRETEPSKRGDCVG